MLAPIRTGIWGDIHNSHDQGSLAKFKRAAAEVPCKDGAHALILSLLSTIFAGALARTMSDKPAIVAGAKISSVDAISSTACVIN